MLLDFGVKGLIFKYGKFLAVHKVTFQDKRLELPGGRVEFGESIEETLIREVNEELGLEFAPVKLIDTWNYMNDTKDHQVAGLIYLCKVIDEEKAIQLSDEHDYYEWVSISEVSKMNETFYPVMKNWKWTELY